VKRKHLELSRTGVPVGGNRPFGWQLDRRTLDPREAELVREAARDVLTGVGLHTIARRWNDAGIKTTAGNAWRRGVVRQMLLSPRLAGYRVYHGKKALNEDGEPVRGLFEPVLDEATWEAVVAVLTAPERVTRHVHVGGRKYLLSGIVRCGRCGSLLHGNANTKWSTFTYACKLPTSGGGCGKVAITGPRLDEMVTELVAAYLADVEVQRTVAPWPREGELETARSKIAELMTAFSSGTLSSDVVFPAVHRLERTVAELSDERSDWLRRQVAVTSRPADIKGDWPSLEVEQRRAIIQSVLDAVVVKPAARTGGRFDPSRVEVVWRP
jgi:site-specific DNA recombinase